MADELLAERARQPRRAWVAAGLGYAALLGYFVLLLAVVAPAVRGVAYYGVAFSLGLVLCLALAWFDRTLWPLLRVPTWQYGVAAALLAGSFGVRVLALGDAPARAGIVLAAMLLAVALVEEWVARGFLWNRLAEALGHRWAVLAGTTVLFWLAHAPNWLLLGFDPVTAAFQALWGLVFGLARLGSGGLVLPIALHAAVNTLGY